jgi:hypothetical protein
MLSLSERKPAPLIRQLLAIVTGSLSAIFANVVYYFGLKEFAGIQFIAPQDASLDPPGIAPLPYTDVILFSAVYCFGASLVFLIIANTVRRPALIYSVISIVILVLSLPLPFMMPTPPVPVTTEASLASMHVLGAAVLVPLLVVIGLPKKVKS